MHDPGAFVPNTLPAHGRPLAPDDLTLLGPAGAAQVDAVLALRDDHRPTPLHAMPALAAALGLGSIHVKDEGYRLGLGSFKALGGAYAVVRLVLEEAARRLGRPVAAGELRGPDVRAVASGLTVACATDGNHGRSVAAGARLCGARAVVFVHAGVSTARADAMIGLGAEVVRVAGTYDDSVAACAAVCARNGWTLVADTSWPGYERVPGLVMQGYTAMVREALAALPAPPSHVFVQAGVGGLAAAVAGHLVAVLGPGRPVFVVVEPARAACLLASAEAGRPVKVAHGEPTVMAMLECFEPSLSAWRILERAADAFMAVGEDEAVAAMRRLAEPGPGEPAVVAGESGGAGLAGLMRATDDPAMRAALGLDASSRILLFNTEGATDPGLYARLVGRTPAAVLARRCLAEAGA